MRSKRPNRPFTTTPQRPTTPKRRLLSTAMLLCLGLTTPWLAFAQDETKKEDAESLDAVIVTGTRVEGRAPEESVSPIDVLYAKALERQAAPELTDQLANLNPSFNTQRFPIADGTAFIRPASLRNLPPDQTLVLVNGKRRHRSALVNLQVEPFGSVNQGAQAVDFGLIPSGAIERVEVLRDGASALYGSDAIAGVINIILKDDNESMSADAQWGSTYEGDGDKYRASLNHGFALGEGGFFNLTAEYFESDFTSRGVPRADAAVVGIARPGSVPFEGLGQRWGDPDADGLRLFANAGIELSESTELYSFASYADQDFDSSFFYRTPVGVAGVGPRGTLFQDSNGDGRADAVAVSLVNSIRAAGLNPADYLTADASSPSGFIALNPIASRFPGGYTPSFGAEIEDFDFALGVRGETAGGLKWDLSGRVAENEVAYLLNNSINPSLGRLSPTSFRPGTIQQAESGVNLDFTYGMENGVNLAFGAEWRNEEYTIGAGDPASFANGPTAALFGVGSDGFQGDGPESAGEFDQDSWAAYVDVETKLSERFEIGLAGRYEDSDAFDSHADFKLSGRFQATDTFALRGTISSGFRAPTPGQINTLDVTTTANSAGVLVPLGTFPVNNPASIALGARPLDVEDSNSYSAGLVWQASNDFTLSADYYHIEVDDRIALASFTITPGSAAQQALINAGVPNAALLGQVSYFTNAFDSEVDGLELVATYNMDFGDNGGATLDWRHAYNRQDVTRVKPGTIDAERVADLENQLPNHRSVLTFEYQTPWNIDILTRANYYSGWEDFTFGEQADFGAEVLVDLAVTWYANDNLRLTVGGNNIFDTLPDRETNSTLNFLGLSHPLSSPFGFNGGEYYVKVAYDFW